MPYKKKRKAIPPSENNHGTAYCGRELRRIVELREMGWDWDSIGADSLVLRKGSAVEKTYRDLRRADLFYHGADDESLVTQRKAEKAGKRKPGIKHEVTEVKGVSRVTITPKPETKK